ncbi:MAG: T9SS type A sorting domain-containing protein [Bacteroidota bacterium]
MKKIYLLGLFTIAGLVLNAQSSLQVTDVNNGMAPVTNNSTIYYTTNANDHLTTEIDAKNTGSSTKYYKLKRVDNVLNSGASAYFCVGGANCYPPNVTVSPLTMTLTANQTLSSQSLSLLLDLEEAPAPGYSSIAYQIYNINDASDVFNFTLKYNDSSTGVKEASSLFSSVSNVYPNPSVNKAYISMTSAFDVNNVNVTVMNSLGAIVYTKNTSLSVGKNVVALDFDNLVSGLYFATISTGNTKITRKFTINK